MTTSTTTPPVIATVPADLVSAVGDVEVCVRHETWGVEVDIRSARSSDRWTPLTMVDGGSVEVRTS